MLIYFVIALLLIFLSASKSKFAFYISATILIMFSALRSPEVGIDLPGYITFFKNPSVATNIVEPGYALFNQLLSKISNSEQFYIVITTLLCNLPIFYVIYKESAHKTFSTLLYLLTGNFLFTFSGIRQSIAIAILFLSAYWLMHKKNMKSLTGILTAALTHISSALFLPIFYISEKWKFSRSKAQTAIILSFFLGFVINPTVFFKLLPTIDTDIEIYDRLLFYQFYFTDIGVPVSRILVQTVPISIIAIVLLRDISIIRSTYFQIFLWATIINNLIISLPIGFRIPKAGLIFMILVISNYSNSRKYEQFFKYSIILFYSLAYVYNIYARMKTGYPNDIVPYISRL